MATVSSRRRVRLSEPARARSRKVACRLGRSIRKLLSRPYMGFSFTTFIAAFVVPAAVVDTFVRPLNEAGLVSLMASPRVAFIKLDPRGCSECASLDEFWDAVDRAFPDTAWRVSCSDKPAVCAVLGKSPAELFDAMARENLWRGPQFHTWNGSCFRHYSGKKELPAISVHLRQVYEQALKGSEVGSELSSMCVHRAQELLVTYAIDADPQPLLAEAERGAAPHDRQNEQCASRNVNVVQVEKMSWHNLSLASLRHHAFTRDLPLHITDVPHSVCNSPSWLESLRSDCADIPVTLAEMSESLSTQHWAGFTYRDSQAAPAQTFHAVLAAALSGEPLPFWVGDIGLTRWCKPKVWRKVVEAVGMLNEGDMLGRFAQWNESRVYPLLYISGANVDSMAHVDNDHTAFWTSVCFGKKIWRLVRNAEMLKRWPTWTATMGRRGLRSQRGLAMEDAARGDVLALNGTLHMGHLAWFPNLHDDAQLAEAMPGGIELFEATVEPGEILYIPQGTIHAARSVGNTVMVVNNFIDASAEGLQRACALWLPVCTHVPHRLNGIVRKSPEPCSQLLRWCSDIVPADRISAANGEW